LAVSASNIVCRHHTRCFFLDRPGNELGAVRARPAEHRRARASDPAQARHVGSGDLRSRHLSDPARDTNAYSYAYIDIFANAETSPIGQASPHASAAPVTIVDHHRCW